MQEVQQLVNKQILVNHCKYTFRKSISKTVCTFRKSISKTVCTFRKSISKSIKICYNKIYFALLLKSGFRLLYE
jgi:hypothetical protein